MDWDLIYLHVFVSTKCPTKSHKSSFLWLHSSSSQGAPWASHIFVGLSHPFYAFFLLLFIKEGTLYNSLTLTKGLLRKHPPFSPLPVYFSLQPKAELHSLVLVALGGVQKQAVLPVSSPWTACT